MNVHPTARSAATSDKRVDMAELRRCIGSAKFGIEAHEAPPEDFPTQPSQKDGLGRMCKAHWNEYTSALRKAALARKATGVADEAAVTQEPRAVAHNGARLKRNAQRRKAEAEAQETSIA
jgi:hypothetical protein